MIRAAKPPWDRTPFTVAIDTREQHPWTLEGVPPGEIRQEDIHSQGVFVTAINVALESLRECDDMSSLSLPEIIERVRKDIEPWKFEGFASDRKQNGKNVPLIIPTISATLKSGDYSIVGLEDQISIERKSISDLFGTLTHGRERFTRLLERLNEMQFAAVVVEADWVAIREYAQTRVNPKTIYRSVIAFQQRFPRVHWWMCDTRRFAERTAFRILDRFWREANP